MSGSRLSYSFAIAAFVVEADPFEECCVELASADVSWLRWDDGMGHVGRRDYEGNPLPLPGRFVITVRAADSSADAFRRAYRIYDAFVALTTLFWGAPIIGWDDGPFEIVVGDVRGETLSVPHVRERFKKMPSAMEPLDHSVSLGDHERLFARVLKEVRRVDEDDLLFDALGYWCAAFRHYVFVGDYVPDVMDEPEWVPYGQFERIQYEESVVNALKAMEALVDRKFNTNEQKFIRTLSDLGAKTDCEITFPGESKFNLTYDGRAKSVGSRLHHLFKTRNARAAHGYQERRPGTPRERTPVTLYEVMEANYATRSALLSVLEQSGERTGEPP